MLTTIHITTARSMLIPALLSIFRGRDSFVPAEDAIEAALVSKSTQKCDLFQRQAILAQVLARAFYLAARDIGARPHSITRTDLRANWTGVQLHILANSSSVMFLEMFCSI